MFVVKKCLSVTFWITFKKWKSVPSGITPSIWFISQEDHTQLFAWPWQRDSTADDDDDDDYDDDDDDDDNDDDDFLYLIKYI